MSQKTDTSSIERSRSGPKAMHFAMMACCVIMLLPIAGYFLAGGALGGLGSNLLTFAPLLLCVGGHFVMHKMMGKSCHTTQRCHPRCGVDRAAGTPRLTGCLFPALRVPCWLGWL